MLLDSSVLLKKDLQIPEIAVETITVEQMIATKSVDRNRAGFFILEDLD
jgi:hypothetical protein